MKNVIEILDLHKSFAEVKAIDGISFSVREGELFAFLGVNGAGKSTTIEIISGHLEKDSGSVTVNGENIDTGMHQIKKTLGIVYQNSLLDKSLSVKDNLKFRAALYGIFDDEFEKRLEELAKQLDFGHLMKRSVGRLSGGERRRIDIARALIHSPSILILDEPTTGLDPQTRHLLWQVIEKMRKERGMTVFLTTHYMEEAAEADYVIILDSGRIAAEGTPIELKNSYTGDHISLYGVEEEAVSKLGLPYEKIGGGYKVLVKNTAAATELIIKNPELFRDYEVTKGKMDDVFLRATGKKLDGGDKI